MDDADALVLESEANSSDGRKNATERMETRHVSVIVSGPQEFRLKSSLFCLRLECHSGILHLLCRTGTCEVIKEVKG